MKKILSLLAIAIVSTTSVISTTAFITNQKTSLESSAQDIANKLNGKTIYVDNLFLHQNINDGYNKIYLSNYFTDQIKFPSSDFIYLIFSDNILEKGLNKIYLEVDKDGQSAKVIDFHINVGELNLDELKSTMQSRINKYSIVLENEWMNKELWDPSVGKAFIINILKQFYLPEFFTKYIDVQSKITLSEGSNNVRLKLFTDSTSSTIVSFEATVKYELISYNLMGTNQIAFHIHLTGDEYNLFSILIKSYDGITFSNYLFGIRPIDMWKKQAALINEKIKFAENKLATPYSPDFINSFSMFLDKANNFEFFKNIFLGKNDVNELVNVPNRKNPNWKDDKELFYREHGIYMNISYFVNPSSHKQYAEWHVSKNNIIIEPDFPANSTKMLVKYYRRISFNNDLIVVGHPLIRVRYNSSFEQTIGGYASELNKEIAYDLGIPYMPIKVGSIEETTYYQINKNYLGTNIDTKDVIEINFNGYSGYLSLISELPFNIELIK